MSSTVLHNQSVNPGHGDAAAEFGCLRSACGVFDLGGRPKISIAGGDRVRWLNGMVTNNVRDLAVGRGVYAFLLNPQGHILCDLYAYNRGDSLVLDIEGSQTEKMLATFDHYIIMDDVELSNRSEQLTAVGIAGPKAAEVLKGIGIDAPQFEPLQFADMTWQGRAVTLVRGDNPAVGWYELWLAPNDSATLRDALKQAGAAPVGTSALELLRIAAGVPRYGQDIRERDLPQETEQERALNFSKGCYIGQEIVERIRSRGAVHRKFSGFDVQGTLPEAGIKIQAEGKDVGEITSATSLPLPGGTRALALGYLRWEMAGRGRKLRAGDAELVVTGLPFANIFPSQNP